jgi:hypothetical protein
MRFLNLSQGVLCSWSFEQVVIVGCFLVHGDISVGCHGLNSDLPRFKSFPNFRASAILDWHLVNGVDRQLT